MSLSTFANSTLLLPPRVRRRMYDDDDVVDKGNLKMVEIAHLYNSAAKFPGSGGAVFGLCREPGKG